MRPILFLALIALAGCTTDTYGGRVLQNAPALYDSYLFYGGYGPYARYSGSNCYVFHDNLGSTVQCY